MYYFILVVSISIGLYCMIMAIKSERKATKQRKEMMKELHDYLDKNGDISGFLKKQVKQETLKQYISNL